MHVHPLAPQGIAAEGHPLIDLILRGAEAVEPKVLLGPPYMDVLVVDDNAVKLARAAEASSRHGAQSPRRVARSELGHDKLAADWRGSDGHEAVRHFKVFLVDDGRVGALLRHAAKAIDEAHGRVSHVRHLVRVGHAVPLPPTHVAEPLKRIVFQFRVLVRDD